MALTAIGEVPQWRRGSWPEQLPNSRNQVGNEYGIKSPCIVHETSVLEDEIDFSSSICVFSLFPNVHITKNFRSGEIASSEESIPAKESMPKNTLPVAVNFLKYHLSSVPTIIKADVSHMTALRFSKHSWFFDLFILWLKKRANLRWIAGSPGLNQTDFQTHWRKSPAWRGWKTLRSNDKQRRHS